MDILQVFMVLLTRVNCGYHALFNCMKGLGTRIALHTKHYILACSSSHTHTYTKERYLRTEDSSC